MTKIIYVKNGYHPSCIEKCIIAEGTRDKTEKLSKKTVLWLPYVKESFKMISTDINNINSLLDDTKIVTFFKTFKTENFFKNKDIFNTDVSSSVFHEFNCM